MYSLTVDSTDQPRTLRITATAQPVRCLGMLIYSWSYMLPKNMTYPALVAVQKKWVILAIHDNFQDRIHNRPRNLNFLSAFHLDDHMVDST